MKSKLIWAIPAVAFAAAILGMALRGPAWATLASRSVMMQAGNATLTAG